MGQNPKVVIVVKDGRNFPTIIGRYMPYCRNLIHGIRIDLLVMIGRDAAHEVKNRGRAGELSKLCLSKPNSKLQNASTGCDGKGRGEPAAHPISSDECFHFLVYNLGICSPLEAFASLNFYDFSSLEIGKSDRRRSPS